ncbi:MAG: ABC transporter substrate-binding protein [Syntrophobacteraceae bacterium]
MDTYEDRQDKPGYSGPIEKVTIGTVGNETSTLVLIAAKMGYFRGNGLDVTIEEYQSGNFSVAALLDNKVDLASCSDVRIPVLFKQLVGKKPGFGRLPRTRSGVH